MMPIPGRAKVPLGLVVLATALVTYTYFVDRKTVSDADRAARAKELFPSFRVDLVKRVELVHGPETLTLERATSDVAGWDMTSPRREPADASAVDSLLRELELAKRVRTVSSDKDLGDPRVRGRITVGPIDYAFTLGADAPQPSGAAYMRIEGEPTFVVGQGLKVQLLRTADAYRTHSLVPYGESEIERVEWTTPAGKLVLQRGGDVLRVGAATGLRASRAAAERVFGALADARVDTFLDDAQVDRDLAPQPRRVAVEARHANRPHVDLTIGGACPGRTGVVVVARAGARRTAACVATRAFEALETTADSLVDRGLVYARPDEIEEVRLESVGTDSRAMDIARRGAGWHVRAPFDRDLNPDEVGEANTFVAVLAGSQAVDVRKGAGPLMPVRGRATLVRTGSGTKEVIEISTLDAEGLVLARRGDDGAVLRLSRATARRFEPHPIALQAPGVWAAPLDPLRVLAVDDTCTPDPQRLELHGAEWKMRLPPGLPVDVGAAMDIVDGFARAQATRWVAESDDGTFGFDTSPKPRPGLGEAGDAPSSCAVTLTLADEGADGDTQTRSIAFGSEEDGSRYARSSHAQGVFLASSTLWDVARHPAIDRGGFRIEPTEGTRVTLSRAGSRVVLAAAGGTFERTGRPRADAGDDKLGNALIALYARYALHAGPPPPSEAFDRPTLQIHVAPRAGESPGAERDIVVGGPGRDGVADIYFARVSRVDATFAVAKATIDAIVADW
jgi:hypothetical protein